MMNKDNPAWGRFIEILEAVLDDEEGYPDPSLCDGKFTQAKDVCELLGVEWGNTWQFLTSNDAYCDCEILMHIGS